MKACAFAFSNAGDCKTLNSNGMAYTRLTEFRQRFVLPMIAIL
jgi:hypothetical protein